MRIEWNAARTRTRQMWRHMDGALGVALVLLAMSGLGWSAKAWQDWSEINRIDQRVHSVQASMAQLCTDRVADLASAYNDRQMQGERLIAEQTERISEQSARIAEQSLRISELQRQLTALDKTTREMRAKQVEVVRTTKAAVKETAQETAKETAKAAVQQNNERVRQLINREVRK